MRPKITAVCFLILALLTGGDAAEKGKVPSEKELKALTLDSLLAFNKAVEAKDFSGFVTQVSKLWQGQVTAAQLADVFKNFIEQQIDIAFIAKADPVFEKPPAIDGDGVLTLEGHYATTPKKVKFRLKYIYEKPAWKLFGIQVNVTPAGEIDAKLPSETELRALVQDSLGNFNQAVLKKNFTEFHGQIAALWQKQTTPPKLQELFKSFLDQKIDLTPSLASSPVFDEPPAINDDGILNLKGSLRSKTERVQFELGYLFETPAWKLVKINVHVLGATEDEK